MWSLVSKRHLRLWSETCSACSCCVAKSGFVSFVSGFRWPFETLREQRPIAVHNAHQLRSKQTVRAPQGNTTHISPQKIFRILCLQVPVQRSSCPWIRSPFLQLDGKEAQVIFTINISSSVQHPCAHGAPWGSPETENFAVFALEDPCGSRRTNAAPRASLAQAVQLVQPWRLQRMQGRGWNKRSLYCFRWECIWECMCNCISYVSCQ